MKGVKNDFHYGHNHVSVMEKKKQYFKGKKKTQQTKIHFHFPRVKMKSFLYSYTFFLDFSKTHYFFLSTK